jgi:hypothetical protein
MIGMLTSGSASFGIEPKANAPAISSRTREAMTVRERLSPASIRLMTHLPASPLWT